MANLNTRIRGLQIKDADITATQLATDAVETAKIKDANVTLAKLELSSVGGYIIITDSSTKIPAYVAVSGDVTITDAGVTAIGATKVTDAMLNNDVATGLAGTGLSASAGVLALDLNEFGTIDAVDGSADFMLFMDASDSNIWKRDSVSDFLGAIAGTGLTSSGGQLNVDAITDNLIEADILMEDESANTNGSSVAFTLSSTPVTNSVQVFLNGLLQQVGSGKDYTLSGTTITFATAPASDDLLIVHYIRND